MPSFPFFNRPYFQHYNYYNRYKYYQNMSKAQKSTTSNNASSTKDTDNSKKNPDDHSRQNTSKNDSQALFSIMGLNLYSDDILILCLLFFLYTQKIEDEMLFLCLVLLLIT